MKDIKEIQERIDKVHESIAKEEKAFGRSLTKTVLVYLLIVVILIGNIIFLDTMILKQATPTNLAIAINTKIQSMIPRFAQNIKGEMKPRAKQAAKKSVALVYAGIPYAKEMLKSQINIYVNQLADDMEKEHMAKFETVIDEALTKAMKNRDLVKNRELGKVLAEQISNDLDKELAKIIDKPFIDAVDKFRLETEELRIKPAAKLTRKEMAEKTFIATWIYLVESKDPEKGVFSNIVQLVNETSKNLQEAM